MSEDDYGMDYDDLDEEEQEMLEETPQKKNLKKLQKRKEPPKPKVRKARFSAFQMPSRIGIVDNETGEVVAEGEAGIFQILANMLERLERIEYKIGNILEE